VIGLRLRDYLMAFVRFVLVTMAIALLASCGARQEELPPFGPIEQPIFGCPSLQGVYVWQAPASHVGFLGQRNARPVLKQLWLKDRSLVLDVRSQDINLRSNVQPVLGWSHHELPKSSCKSGMLSVGVDMRVARMRDGSLAVGVRSDGRARTGNGWSWVQLRKVGDGLTEPAPLDASQLEPPSNPNPSQPTKIPLESMLPTYSERKVPASLAELMSTSSAQRQGGLLAAALIAVVMLFFAFARQFGSHITAGVIAGVWLAAVVIYYLARLKYYGGASLVLLIPATAVAGGFALFVLVLMYGVYSNFFFPPKARKT
jgi:hypothetical protein